MLSFIKTALAICGKLVLATLVGFAFAAVAGLIVVGVGASQETGVALIGMAQTAGFLCELFR